MAEKPSPAIVRSDMKETVKLSPDEVTVGGFIVPQNRPPLVVLYKTGDVINAPSLNTT